MASTPAAGAGALLVGDEDIIELTTKTWDDAAKQHFAANPELLEANLGLYGELSHGLDVVPRVPSLLARPPGATKIDPYRACFMMLSLSQAYCLVHECNRRPIACSTNKNARNEPTSTKFDAVIAHMETRHPELIVSDSPRFVPRPAKGSVQQSLPGATAASRKRQSAQVKDSYIAAAVDLLIARPDLSFRVVASPAMEKFVMSVTCNDEVDWPGRTAIVKGVDEMAQTVKMLWVSELASHTKSDIGASIPAGVTSDGWSNISKMPFATVTTTVVTKKWRFLNLLLGIERFSHPHTAQRYYELVHSVLRDWSVTPGVITTDGGSNMVKAFKDMGRFYCMGHGFTVMFNHVKHVPKLATDEVAKAVLKKRKAKMKGSQDEVEGAAVDALAAAQRSFAAAEEATRAKKLSQTGKVLRAIATLSNALTIGRARVQYFKRMAAKVQPETSGRLLATYEARWWHETLAAQRMVEMLPTLKSLDFGDKTGYSFARVELRDRIFNLRKVMCEEYLPAIARILPLYRRFADWTAFLSCRNAPTVSLVLYAIMDLSGCVDYHVKKLVRDEKSPAVAAPLQEVMMEEFHAAFLKAYNIKEFREFDYLRWSAVLDPRVVLYFGSDAMTWLEEIFVYAETYVSGWLTEADLKVPAQQQQTPAGVEAAAVTNVFAAAVGDATPATVPAGVSPWRSEKPAYIAHLAKLEPGVGKCLKMDPCAWWESIEPSVPRLARAARALLATQATSVFSESVFSVAGMVFSKRRSRLAEDRGAALVLLNNWKIADEALHGPRVPPEELPVPWTELVMSPDMKVHGLVDLDAIADEAKDALDAAAEATLKAALADAGEQGDTERALEDAADAEVAGVELV